VKKGIRWKLSFIAMTVFLSVLFFLPSTPIYSRLPSWWGKFLPSKGITLGLDLQGGMHLVLEVQGEKAVENALDRTANSLKDLLAEKKINVNSVQREGNEIVVALGSAEAKDHEEVGRLARENYPILTAPKNEGNQVSFEMKESEINRIKEAATSQALETIRNRVDQFGVAEPLIQRQGPQQILIQLPGIKDPQRAIDLIGKTALLEFKLVDDDSPVSRELPLRVAPEDEAKFLKDFEGKMPPDDQILFERVVDKENNNVGYKRPFLVKKNAAMSGDTLTDARVNIGQFNEPYVSITFDSSGAKLFEKVTAENRKKRLAIILDNSVYSAPEIKERIGGGRAQISGSFTVQEANDLAIVLRAGALPAPVKIIQNVTVGPSLGADSIKYGIMAGVVGTALVVLFMVFYYRLSGLIADFNLFLNIVLLIGAMAFLNATLTLPGIAGIILTVGMSVDSNVLIFERIREELRAGKPVRIAVEAGYDKAFLTIIDSHVTTLITAIILFIFGTGPIKGFAVSLSLGVTINLFTSLVGTKVIFDIVNGRRKLEALSI
jgi:preprotein translocase subunit SecD